jgi:hypothetical protein
MIERAIKLINPLAEFSVIDDDINRITWLNGTTPISKDEILAKVPEATANYEAKIQAEENIKISGNQKLLNLGLTQEEVTALTGYKPPVS